jgi:hypothetical protein
MKMEMNFSLFSNIHSFLTKKVRMDGETPDRNHSFSLSTLCRQHRNDCTAVDARFRNMGTVSTRREESGPTPRSWALLQEPPVAQVLKNSPTFYETQRFITVFTRALHSSLSTATSIQSISPYLISLRPILILLSSSHLCLVLPSGIFHPGNPICNLVMPMRAIRPPHLILLDLIILNAVA